MARPRNPRTNTDSEDFDAEHVVDTHWPYSFTRNRLLAAVRTVDELARWACHALISPRRSDVLEHPADISTVIGNLNATLHKLDQVLDYSAAELAAKAARGELYHHDITPADRWEPHGAAFAQGAAEGTGQAIERARKHLLAAAHELGATGIGAFGFLDPKDRPEETAKPRPLRVVE